MAQREALAACRDGTVNVQQDIDRIGSVLDPSSVTDSLTRLLYAYAFLATRL